MAFIKATRKKAKLRLALTGPSGSGKTRSALELAKGIGGKIALIDTEHSSASLYSDITDFDTMDLSAPFTPDRYIAAIKEAEEAGYDVLIIDSITHEWMGKGGVLEMHSAATKANNGNSYTAWASITPKHNAFIEAILQSPIHVITTMRSKQDYVLAEKNGKQVPQKVGMAPIQREGYEYEMTVVFDITIDGHVATASKDRTRLFDGDNFVVTAETGKRLIEWLEMGVEPPPVEKPKDWNAIGKEIADAYNAASTLDELQSHREFYQEQIAEMQKTAKKFYDLLAGIYQKKVDSFAETAE